MRRRIGSSVQQSLFFPYTLAALLVLRGEVVFVFRSSWVYRINRYTVSRPCRDVCSQCDDDDNNDLCVRVCATSATSKNAIKQRKEQVSGFMFSEVCMHISNFRISKTKTLFLAPKFYKNIMFHTTARHRDITFRSARTTFENSTATHEAHV